MPMTLPLPHAAAALYRPLHMRDTVTLHAGSKVGPSPTRMEASPATMSRERHVLIADIHPQAPLRLADDLARYGHRVSVAHQLAQLRQALTEHHIDLLLMDLRLHPGDGLGLVREIRRASDLPIILVTGEHELAERVIGLEMGADDVVARACEPRELVARVQAVLRRSRRRRPGDTDAAPLDEPEVRCFGAWRLHLGARQLCGPDGATLTLPLAEYQLLCAFLQCQGEIISRARLMQLARGRQLSLSSRSIDLLVSRLRKKLGDDLADPPLIRTVRGLGYLFEVAT